MKQYAEKIVTAIKKVLKKPVDKNVKIMFDEKLKSFMKVYLSILDNVGIKNYNHLNEKLTSDSLMKLGYKYAVEQVESDKFGKVCREKAGCNLDRCMRLKMAENIIDNICLLIPLRAMNMERSSVQLAESINYTNNVAGYKYMYRLICALDNANEGKETFDDNPELEEKLKKYSSLKSELAKFY